ncbi:MAG: hypothetical protein WC322_00240 [Candidatus Paceibacterota bacterium]|jgi:hypothetical protein
MNADLLTIAGVPETLRTEALANLVVAEERSRGLLWHKIKVRYWYASDCAAALSWKDNRLIDVKPEWASRDIAPVRNVSCNGDNPPWDETGPVLDAWLDQDPASADYRLAVQRNYWLPGTHPRSYEARKAWYRRNGGEYEAWARGWPIDVNAPYQVWEGTQGRTQVTVQCCSGAWQVDVRKNYGPIVIEGHYGFEISNVFTTINGPREQSWYPLPGYELRAPVCWATIPRIRGWND